MTRHLQDEKGGGIRAVFRAAVDGESQQALILRLTLLLLVLHGASTPPAAVVVRTIGLLMLVVPGLLTASRAWWWLITGVLVFSKAEQWDTIDNHQYLLTYWTAVCAITLRTPTLMAINARLLIVVAFAAAVVWKLLAGQYVDGRFFYFTLLTDGRLRNIAGLFTPGGAAAVGDVSAAFFQLLRIGEAGAALNLPESRSLQLLALGMSWSGLAVESFVAAAHLLPSRRWRLVRHASLMGFVAFTYLVLPVIGFGFLLGILGLAQVESDDLRLRRMYLVLLCFLQLTLVPWRALLTS